MCRMLHETNHRGMLCVCGVPTLQLVPELLLYNSLPKSKGPRPQPLSQDRGDCGAPVDSQEEREVQWMRRNAHQEH